MRDDLHGLAEVFALAFLVEDVLIDLSAGEVVVAGEVGVGETFVMAEVEVSLGAVVEHIDLAVLERAHGARIDVEVRVEFLQCDLQSARLQQRSKGRRCESFAQGTDHTTGDKNVFHLEKLKPETATAVPGALCLRKFRRECKQSARKLFAF